MELSKVKYAALNLTHNCNLRCTYCYAGEKQPKSMDTNTAFHAVDFLANQIDGDCTITFFGGEPLTEYELIRKVVEYSEKHYGTRVRFRMSTNGTLLNAEILKYFKQHAIYFTLSIDGNKIQHDSCRRYANGKGSYSEITNKLSDILDFNPYTLAVSVIVPETAKYLAAGVKDLFEKGFRYVLQTLDYNAAWTSKDIKMLKDQYEILAKYYQKSLLHKKKIYYSPFDERIRTHAQKPYEKGDLCDLANTQIAIAPSGNIYPCVQFIGNDDETYQQNTMGNVEKGFDTKRREYFVMENYAERDSCRGCTLIGRCATYCGCINWRATGSLRLFPSVICEHERMLMPIVDNMANELWEKRSSLFKRKFYENTFPVSSYIEDCLMKQGR